MEAVKKLNQLIAGFSNAPRIGESVDDPEGARYIQISDTLIKDIIDTLQQIKISIINSQEELKEANKERFSFRMSTLSDGDFGR